MRTLRALVVLGGMGVLVALPPEDYARLWANAADVSSRAVAMIDKHIVTPIRSASGDAGAARPRVESATPDEPLVAPRPVAITPKTDAPRTPELRETLASREYVSDAAPAVYTAEAGPDSLQHPGLQNAGKSRVAEVADTAQGPAAENGVVTAVQPGAATEDGSQDDAVEGVGRSNVVVAPAPMPAPSGHSAATNVGPAPPSASQQMPEPQEEKKPLVAAKLLFGAVKSTSPLAARSIGYYSRGCLAGGKALSVDGPAWQAMRLSRNRNWGHPRLIKLIERFASEVQKEDGWSGLLVGDISQPRGGPMLTGHSSHQIGLDADIWFTPMPGRRLSRREREDLAATSMIAGPTRVDPTAFTPSHVKVVKRAASYPEVERILVHPAIKKALCEAAGTDRAWLAKVRPYFGHHYHFHVRIACPPGSANCRAQNPTTADDGCGKELDDWFARLTQPPAPKPPGYKPPPPKPPITMADLPLACRVVLSAGNGATVKDEAELIKTSIERSQDMIDISGRPRAEVAKRQ